MDERPTRKKTAAIVGIAALAVISVLIAFFAGSLEKNQHETITLPDPPAAETPSAPTVTQPEDVFAQISTQNVQSVLSGLSRPAFYHQTLTLTTYSGESTREQQAELWVAGEQMLVRTTDSFETKSFLTDGQTLYIWYSEEDTPARLLLGETFTRDDLTGVPTYEALLALPVSQLTAAEYLTLSDEDELPCVFVESTQGEICCRYWISLGSGLLYSYAALTGNDIFYTAKQTRLEILMDGDEAFDGVFQLPDGTRPFDAAPQG